MFITQTITKKILENFISKNFSQLGNLVTSKLLDSLKLLGFYYATNSGLSINIEDLRIPEIKKEILKETLNAQKKIETACKTGELSEIENSQKVMNLWHLTANLLKDKIIYYYNNFDPVNSLYIMAFSGARGNISQVRQLIGMRGLMADQEGNIINLPIKTNFREGLSLIDYLISSYGARKGIVDTALKTANSGYLTRRLIYVAQDVIIRDTDCNTTRGLNIVLFNKTQINKNLIGRYCIGFKSLNSTKQIVFLKERILTPSFLEALVPFFPLVITIRSSLTCKAHKAICQKCYGWDLAQQKIISLGDAVGIIAAQSIGEPGTQLTMRTFHTGGVFTSESAEEIKIPFSSYIKFPESLKKLNYRTNFGENLFMNTDLLHLTLKNWQGKKLIINFKKNTEIYIKNLSYVLKGSAIAKQAEKNITIEIRKLKPLYTTFSGEINFKRLKLYTYKGINFVIKEGLVEVAGGIKLELPATLKYRFIKRIKKEQPFGLLKIITPISGISIIKNNILSITNKEQTLSFNLNIFTNVQNNYFQSFYLSVKNYQILEAGTTLGYSYYFPMHNASIINVRQKNLKKRLHLLIITEMDCIKINTDQVNIFRKKMNKPSMATIFNETSYNLKTSSVLLNQIGFKLNFQQNISIFLKRGTLLKVRKNSFISKFKNFATLLYYIQQNEDIVQGLPKIENLIDVTLPKNSCVLAVKPSIYLVKRGEVDKSACNLQNLITHKISFKLNNAEYPINCQSFTFKKNYIKYNTFLYEYTHLPSIFKPQLIFNQTKKTYIFIKKHKYINLEKHKEIKWEKTRELLDLHQSNFKLLNFTKFKQNKNLIIYSNSKKDLIIEYKKFTYIYLQKLSPIETFNLKTLQTLTDLAKPGTYIDLAEPLTLGNINLLTLLTTLTNYHTILNGFEGNLISITKFQLILINSIQAIYDSQDIQIALKHIEIIARQMTAKVKIESSGHTPFLNGELINLELACEVYKFLEERKQINYMSKYYKLFKMTPIVYSITNATLNNEGFLAAAGFQGTQKILTKAAIEGTTDWLRGLKESIITNRYIPTGTTFLNYKNYLDNIYSYKI